MMRDIRMEVIAAAGLQSRSALVVGNGIISHFNQEGPDLFFFTLALSHLCV